MYKRLFTEDEHYNNDGLEFQKEYVGIIVPFIEKYMLLGFACKDIEYIMMQAITLQAVTLQMKRLHGLSPFKKEEEENSKSPCDDCMDSSSCPVFKEHGKVSSCPFIIDGVMLHPDETLMKDLKWCPNCGCGAKIITWPSELGIRYRCSCGLMGRFGDGTSEPSKEQPGFEEE